MRRPGLVLAALATLALSLSPASGQAPPGAERLCGAGSDAALKDGPWTTVEKPNGLPRITAHAVGGASGKLMLVTDGRVVMRSSDAGCSWSTVYEVETPSAEGSPADGLLPEVGRLLIPNTSSRALMVLEGVGRAAAARVLHSDEGGGRDSWRESTGLPSVSGFRELVAAPDNPDVVYLLTGVVDAAGQVDPAGASGPLYVSRDGGRSFAEAATAGGQIEKLAVEPDTGGRYLWVVRGNGTIQHSRDYGATFVTLTPGPPSGEDAPDPAQGELPTGDHWRDIAVHRFATTSHAVVALASPTREADVTRAVVTFTKGAVWEEMPVDGLGPAGGLFFGADPAHLYSTVPTANTAYRGPGLVQYDIDEARWRTIDAFNLGPLWDPRAVREPKAGQPQYDAIWLRRDRPDDAPDLLARFEPPAAELGTLTLKGRPDCGSTKAKTLPDRKVEFKPGGIDVRLEPGEPRSVPVVADMNADATPSDVYFLLDHSDSMDPAIEGLFCSVERLVRDLPDRNLDVHFGLGAFNGIDQYTYRRLVNILPPKEAGPAFSEALKTLFSTNGVDEPLRSALYQTATGAGMEKGNRARAVEPGQQADWRPDEKKIPRVVLIVTDEPYEPRTAREPSLEQVLEALRAKDIKAIGLRVQPLAKEQATSADHNPARQLLLLQQLTEIARGSGALAPKGGVDCDGGGSPDIAEGQPIVCSIDESGIKSELDDTLVSIFQSFAGQDLQAVRLVPRKTSGLSATVQGGEAEVDLRRASRLEGTAVLACTEEQAGQRFPLIFDVVAGERVLGSLEGTAECGDLPAAVAPVVPGKAKPAKPEAQPKPAAKKAPMTAPDPPAPAPVPPVQVPQPAVAAAPPPAPPAPAPASSAPAQAPASAQAPAAQTGAAAQEHREVAAKLATVTTDSAGSDDAARGQHAMVAVKRRTVVPVEAAVTLGLGISGLFGYVAFAADPRRRRRRAAEPARIE